MEIYEKDVINEATNKAILVPFKSLKLSYENLKIGKPYRQDDPTALVQEIYPQ
jgi:hypothetical protein